MRKFLGAPYPIQQTPNGLLAQSSGVDQIKADLLQLILTNPGERCLTGDTVIALANGTNIPIQELVGKESFWVYSFDTDSNMIVPGKATAFKTIKNAELLEITLDNNEKVKCTPNHLWLMRDSTYKRADELNEGDSLMPFYRHLNTSKYERIYQPKLQNYRETHLCFVSEKRLTGIREVVHHKDLNKHNNNPDNLQWMTCKDHKELHKEIRNAFNHKIKNDPNFYNEWVESLKKGLAKYYETHDGNRKGCVLSEETKNKLSETKKIFYETEEGKNLKIKLSELAKEQFKDGNHPFKGKKFTEEHRKNLSGPRPNIAGENNPSKRPEVKEKLRLAWEKRKKKNHKVIEIKKLTLKEDCYDLHVEKYHNFALNVGVFVHNCMMPLYGTPLRKFFFEPNDPALEEKVREEIIRSISTWEPRIIINNIRVSRQIDENALSSEDTLENKDHILYVQIDIVDPEDISTIRSLVLFVPIGGEI